MSISQKEAKEGDKVEDNLLNKNNQNLNHPVVDHHHSGLKEVKVEKVVKKMAVGIYEPSNVAYTTGNIPPEKKRMLGVDASTVAHTIKNSSTPHKKRNLKEFLLGDDAKNSPRSHIMKGLSIGSPPVSTDSLVLNENKVSRSNDEESHIRKIERNSEKDTAQPTPRKKQKRSAPPKREGQLAGRWSSEEHELFLEGLNKHGREWKKVAEKIKTRTSAQIRSHAQKYFSKLAKESGQMNSYDGYMSGSSHIMSHSSTDTLGEGSDEAMIFDSATPYLSSSIIQKIERIMKNPTEVENEVEATLKSLSERYAQLQRQLQEQQQQNRAIQQNIISQEKFKPKQSMGTPRTSISVPISINSSSMMIVESPSFHSSPAVLSNEVKTSTSSSLSSITGPATAALEQWQREEAAETNSKQVNNQMHPKPAQSCPSSKISQSLALASPNRDFGCEELIALQVLGGALSSSSKQDQTRIISSPACASNAGDLQSSHDASNHKT